MTTPRAAPQSQHETGREVAVRLRDVAKHFGEGAASIRAVRGVTLDIYANELLMLVGPSGCGKTTLLSMICGVLDADHGDIDVFGTPWTKLSPAAKTARRGEVVGYVFQQFNLIPTLDIRTNVAVPLLIRGVPMRDALTRADKALENVGLGDRVAAAPANLSGGMQQRVAIARALVGEPRLLVCDEPTANLDGHTGQKIIEIVRDAAHPEPGRPSRCVIVVTHDARVFRYADRIERMEDGRLIGELPPDKTDPEMLL